LVGARGFEPPTTCTPCRYATRLRYAPTARIITQREGGILMSAKKPFLSGIFRSRRAACIVFCLTFTSIAYASTPGGTSTIGKSSKSDNGAIAYHRASGSFGYAVNRHNLRDAKIEALKQCNNADCEVVLTLKSSCGALASHKQTYFVSRGATREESEAKARRQCGPKCEVLVWACTK
jgi:hypothetical protein